MYIGIEINIVVYIKDICRFISINYELQGTVCNNISTWFYPKKHIELVLQASLAELVAWHGWPSMGATACSGRSSLESRSTESSFSATWLWDADIAHTFMMLEEVILLKTAEHRFQNINSHLCYLMKAFCIEHCVLFPREWTEVLGSLKK